MAFYFYRVCRRIQGIAHGRRDLGYAVLTGSGHLHRSGTVLAGLDLRIEAAAPHGKFRIGQLFVLIVNIPFYNAQGIAALCVFHGNPYIRNVGNRSVLILLRYVKRTLRIVPFVPLRRTALYRHIAAVWYAGFNGFAIAVCKQRIDGGFVSRILRGVYFKLRSEQGVPSLIGLFYGQRAGLGRIFNRHSVAPVRRDLEGYKLFVQFIALRSYLLLQIISAQRQRYFAGTAVCSYYLVLYRIITLIQHLKYRAAQELSPVGAYLFNGKLLLHPGIGPYSRNAAYVFASCHSVADAHIICVVAARIALRRYYLRKLIHAIRHVLKADPPLIVGNGIHLLDGGIRRAASLYKLQLEHRPCEALARAVGFGEA